MMITLTNAAKAITASIAALTVVLGLALTVAEPHIDKYLTNRIEIVAPTAVGGPCATIPTHGHLIEDTPRDHWGVSQYRDVVRHRDNCGTPEISAVISNGGNILHDAPLSITGIPLTVGTHTLSYQFFVDEEVREGPGRFRVFVTYPDAINGAPPAISPWLSFNILE